MQRKWKIIVLILLATPYLFWHQIYNLSPILGGFIALVGAVYMMAGVGGAFRSWVIKGNKMENPVGIDV